MVDAISNADKSLWPGDNYHPTNSHVMASLIRNFRATLIQQPAVVEEQAHL